MLVVKVFVNFDQIDELHIQNTDRLYGKRTIYVIKEPQGYDDIEIYHLRSESWTKLVEKALHVINLRNPTS
jgi:hypothetical protein